MQKKTHPPSHANRLAVKDLGVLFDESGDVSNALKYLAQVKDFCTTPATHFEACMLVAEAALANVLFSGGYNYGHNFCSKAEAHLPKGNQKDVLLTSKVSCLFGIYELSASNYYEAAKRFTKASIDMRGKYAKIIAIEDVATYGALCALASFTRTELKDQVVENVNFKVILETVPLIRTLVVCFFCLSVYVNKLTL